MAGRQVGTQTTTLHRGLHLITPKWTNSQTTHADEVCRWRVLQWGGYEDIPGVLHWEELSWTTKRWSSFPGSLSFCCCLQAQLSSTSSSPSKSSQIDQLQQFYSPGGPVSSRDHCWVSASSCCWYGCCWCLGPDASSTGSQHLPMDLESAFLQPLKNPSY